MARSKIPMGLVVNNPNITSASQVDTMNTVRRLPVIILIDTSGSMRPYEQTLHDAVVALYDGILNDKVAGNAVELSIMEFNNYINILVPMCEIYKQEDRGSSLHFHCDGQTLTGLALREALSQLENRKTSLRRTGVQCYAPILFLISDGHPYCTVEGVQEENLQALNDSLHKIKALVSGNHLNVVCVEVGNDCDTALMRSLTGRSGAEQAAWVRSIDASSRDLSRYFVWMSKYIRLSAGAGAVKPD